MEDDAHALRKKKQTNKQWNKKPQHNGMDIHITLQAGWSPP